MADPKYAGLPGIAVDEPDVYESECLPESDQALQYEDTSDNVEKIDVSHQEAFNKFRGKTLDASSVDFSDKISRCVRTGYNAYNDLELVARGEAETPLQKYNRLQCEMKELFEEVEALKSNKSGDQAVGITTDMIEAGLKQLADLKLEQTLGEKVISSIMDPQGAQLRELQSQIEQFKNYTMDKPESEKQMSDDGIVFQLKYRPEHMKFEQSSKVADLEMRLHRLESAIGPSNEKLSRLLSATKQNGLLAAVQHLDATTKLLDPAQLDHIEGRLTALVQKMETVAQKEEQAGGDAEKDKMILELYEMVKNSENVSQLLPQTIERLQALEALHAKATNFTTSLTQVEAIQAQIKDTVDNNKALIKGVQQSFATNLEEINKTVSGLDARIKALTKK